MRIILLIVGVVTFLFGLLFALQGSGFVHWPSDSFMLDQSVWTTRGIIIAVVGAVIILLSRRAGKR